MSINDPDAFWGSLALDFLDWIKKFDKVMDGNFKDGVIKWFTGGKLNVSGLQLASYLLWFMITVLYLHSELCWPSCTTWSWESCSHLGEGHPRTARENHIQVYMQWYLIQFLITFKISAPSRQLLHMVCQIANVLKEKDIRKGDIVAIYMPVCPLAVASMLACTRIGAVHK